MGASYSYLRIMRGELFVFVFCNSFSSILIASSQSIISQNPTPSPWTAIASFNMQDGYLWRTFPFRSQASGNDVEVECVMEVNEPVRDQIRSILIVCHGRERDAKQIFQQARQSISDNNALIIAPHFINGTDKVHVQGQTKKLLIWKGNDWGEGGSSKATIEGDQISSFEVLDSFISFYGDRTRFKNVKKVILLGHSLGGQMIQRYSILGKGLEYDQQLELVYVVMNPSTYLYLKEDIPYKYGLAGREKAFVNYSPAVSISVREIWLRLQKRKVFYLHGQNDSGIGDERPLAMMQGKDRIERSQSWCNYLHFLVWPKLHSFAYVSNTGHDAGKMMASSQFQRILLT